MALYHDMQQLIGDTPLVKLNHIDLPDGANLYAKLELYNPSGSVKYSFGFAKDKRMKSCLIVHLDSRK